MRKNQCHVCKQVFPVESVAMLHCRGDKTFEDDGEDLYLMIDGEDIRIPI